MRIILLLVVMGTSAAASPGELTQRFAQCAGRMSAEMEFEWLMGRTGEEAELFRGHLEDLLDAVAGPNEGRQILNLRVEAKYAHARLLTRAHFNDDKDDAAQAMRLSAQLSDSCRTMLMG